MTLQDVDLKAILALTHSLYWLLIFQAATIRRKGTRSKQEGSTNAVATRLVTSSRAEVTQLLTGITQSLYNILLTLWWFKPELAGPIIFPFSLPLQLGGIVILIISLVLKTWGFWAFRTWRLYPHIEPGHELVTTGPYALVRHPLYLSGQFLYLGSFLLVPQLGFLAQFLLNLCAYDFRIRVEEEVLTEAFGENYQKFQEKTSRLIPWVY
ncbi:MAG: isoprenylcysteine carboxylmethyltransferase family protein [Hormoscilla sp.]